VPNGTTLTGVFDFTPAVSAPEPSSLWVAALGGVAFAGFGWRRSRRGRASA
jgi:hypothetical protein